MDAMDWPSLFKYLIYWGPGALIAALLIYALYRLTDKFIDKFVVGFMSLGQEFISAQKEQAASLAKMACGTEGLRDCINIFVTRDQQEHREMIILLKYTREQIETLTNHLKIIASHLPEHPNGGSKNREISKNPRCAA